MRRIIDTIWSYFKLGVAAILFAAMAIGVYFYAHMDDEICRHLELEFGQRFPDLDVSIGSARVVEGRGIVVEDVSFAVSLPSGQREQVLSIDRLTLLCDVALKDLVRGTPTIRGIEALRPQLWLKQLRSGEWNFSRWTPVGCGNLACPRITIRQGALSVGSEALPHLPPLALDGIEFDVALAAEKGERNRLSDGPLKVDASGRATDRSSVGSLSRSAVGSAVGSASGAHEAWGGTLQIEGVLRGPRLRLCEVRSLFDPVARRWDAHCRLERFEIAEETHAWLKAALPSSLREAQLTAQADGTISLRHVFGGDQPPEIDAQFAIHGGRIEDPRLARPMVEIDGKLTATWSQLRIEEMRGAWGDAQVAISVTRNGWTRDAPLALAGQIQRVPLDASLYRSLPLFLRAEWDKYAPAGEADGEFQAVFAEGRWRPVAGRLTGRNLSFQSDKFPYRLVQGSGSLRFHPAAGNDPSRIDIDLVGYGGGQPLEIVGQVFDPQPSAAGWVKIAGRDVQIEQSMIDALPQKPKRVIASLHPMGRFDLEWKLERTTPGQAKPHKSLVLKLHELAINYDHFAYPLRGIEGTIVAEDDRWAFRDLVSVGRRAVRCEGQLEPDGDGTELSLHFEGEQIPLDDDLFEAVSPPVQQAWRELQARGHVDFNADVRHRSGLPKPTIHAVIRPCPATAQAAPRFFDYLLENVSGAIVYEDGAVALEDVRATHANTTLKTNGSGAFGSDGSWHFQLTDLNIDKINVDKFTSRHDLLVALPRRLQRVFDALRPTGYFSLSEGNLAFRKSAVPTAPLEARWRLQLNCHQTDLQTGIELKNIHGAVRLDGAYDGRRSYASGDLELDAVTFQDIVFTGVRGPLWVDETQCLLGQYAASLQRVAPRRLTAAAYDGDVAADARVLFESLPKYVAEIDWVGADLDRLVLERFGGTARFGGKVDAKLSLFGEGRQLESMKGRGAVLVREADIYELPMLLGMLKMLRTGSANTTAFDRSEMQFQLSGKHVTIDQLDFLGNVVNLYGKGYANFDQQLNLEFHGVVGRNASRLPFVKSVVGKVNQQFHKMYVSGTLDNPQVTSEALPQVKRFLEQIQTDLASPPRTPPR